jgi:hypothetical protein
VGTMNRSKSSSINTSRSNGGAGGLFQWLTRKGARRHTRGGSQEPEAASEGPAPLSTANRLDWNSSIASIDTSDLHNTRAPRRGRRHHGGSDSGDCLGEFLRDIPAPPPAKVSPVTTGSSSQKSLAATPKPRHLERHQSAGPVRHSALDPFEHACLREHERVPPSLQHSFCSPPEASKRIRRERSTPDATRRPHSQGQTRGELSSCAAASTARAPSISYIETSSNRVLQSLGPSTTAMPERTTIATSRQQQWGDSSEALRVDDLLQIIDSEPHHDIALNVQSQPTTKAGRNGARPAPASDVVEPDDLRESGRKVARQSNLATASRGSTATSQIPVLVLHTANLYSDTEQALNATRNGPPPSFQSLLVPETAPSSIGAISHKAPTRSIVVNLSSPKMNGSGATKDEVTLPTESDCNDDDLAAARAVLEEAMNWDRNTDRRPSSSSRAAVSERSITSNASHTSLRQKPLYQTTKHHYYNTPTLGETMSTYRDAYTQGHNSSNRNHGLSVTRHSFAASEATTLAFSEASACFSAGPAHSSATSLENSSFSRFSIQEEDLHDSNGSLTIEELCRQRARSKLAEGSPSSRLPSEQSDPYVTDESTAERLAEIEQEKEMLELAIQRSLNDSQKLQDSHSDSGPSSTLPTSRSRSHLSSLSIGSSTSHNTRALRTPCITSGEHPSHLYGSSPREREKSVSNHQRNLRLGSSAPRPSYSGDAVGHASLTSHLLGYCQNFEDADKSSINDEATAEMLAEEELLELAMERSLQDLQVSSVTEEPKGHHRNSHSISSIYMNPNHDTIEDITSTHDDDDWTSRKISARAVFTQSIPALTTPSRQRPSSSMYGGDGNLDVLMDESESEGWEDLAERLCVPGRRSSASNLPNSVRNNALRLSTHLTSRNNKRVNHPHVPSLSHKARHSQATNMLPWSAEAAWSRTRPSNSDHDRPKIRHRSVAVSASDDDSSSPLDKDKGSFERSV